MRDPDIDLDFDLDFDLDIDFLDPDRERDLDFDACLEPDGVLDFERDTLGSAEDDLDNDLFGDTVGDCFLDPESDLDRDRDRDLRLPSGDFVRDFARVLLCELGESFLDLSID